MNDDQMRREIGSWLEGTDPAPPDAHESVRRAMSRTPQVRQRSRWWPLPALDRSTSPPTTDQTTDLPPTSIPASNGHTPTVPGRIQSMLSPAKAVTAGALVFALGGVLLIAQPFDQQGGSVPGAEADDETTPATLVTGEMGWASSCASPIVEIDGDVIRTWDRLCAPQTWTADDPRLSGEAVSTWNTYTYLVDGERKSVLADAYFLRNEHGGWACRSHLLVDGGGEGGSWEGFETVMCEGEGEYDGLSAIIDFDEPVSRDGTTAQPMVGLIFPGDAPPHPAPPAAE